MREEVRPEPSAVEGSGLPSAALINTPMTKGTVERKGLFHLYNLYVVHREGKSG